MIHSHHPQLLNINPTPTTVTPGDSAEGLGRAHLLVEPSLAGKDRTYVGYMSASREIG